MLLDVGEKNEVFGSEKECEKIGRERPAISERTELAAFVMTVWDEEREYRNSRDSDDTSFL